MDYFTFSLDALKTIVLVIYSMIFAICRYFVPLRFRMKSVEGKIILITGAGSGLGASLAVSFAKRKARLVLWDINSDGLRDTMEKCRKYQSETYISTFKVDVSDRKQVLDTAENVKTGIGFVDILINNAGIVVGKSILELDEKSVARTFNVNVVSHIWTIQAFLPEMLSRNSGQVVSIASMAGLVATPKLSDYSASKSAAISLQETLAYEIRVAKKTGVHCLTVCPFFINTGMFDGTTSITPILPIIDLNYATMKIEEAILSNSNVLYIPKIIYFLIPFKYLLPEQGFIYLTDLVKADSMMDDFHGRK